MHINLRKLQQTINDAELLEPEGVDKHFTTAFKKKSKRTVSKSDIEEDHEKKESMSKINIEHLDEESMSKPESDTVQISGSPVKILAHDQRPDLADVRKKEGNEIREAEKEILKAVSKGKEPPSIQNKPNISAKDALLFTRASATMTLSALQSVEQTHLASKKFDSLKQKTNTVATIRKERATRRAKIETFKRKVRDQARDWKNDEDHKLEEQREKIKERRMSNLLKQSVEYDQATKKRLEQIQEQKHACEFAVQNTMIGTTLDKEDFKAQKESEAAEMRDMLREAREQAQEKQEMVKRYMELRRVKLLQEGEEARKKLNSKMLEVSILCYIEQLMMGILHFHRLLPTVLWHQSERLIVRLQGSKQQEKLLLLQKKIFAEVLTDLVRPCHLAKVLQSSLTVSLNTFSSLLIEQAQTLRVLRTFGT